MNLKLVPGSFFYIYKYLISKCLLSSQLNRAHSQVNFYIKTEPEISQFFCLSLKRPFSLSLSLFFPFSFKDYKITDKFLSTKAEYLHFKDLRRVWQGEMQLSPKRTYLLTELSRLVLSSHLLLTAYAKGTSFGISKFFHLNQFFLFFFSPKNTVATQCYLKKKIFFFFFFCPYNHS